MDLPKVRIQVCGRLAVEVDGRRVEAQLPGRQGRLLLTYLVLHRHDSVTRGQLVDALWPTDPPGSADAAVYALLSRLRTALGAELVASRGSVGLTLPSDAWVDLDAARDAIHRGESALALGEWGRAWGAAQVTLFASRRGFLPDEELDWVASVRRELEGLYVRALETYAAAALELGGTELATAERASGELVAAAPFRESGYRLRMRALVRRGNTAEALLAYDQLCGLLRDELGVAPSAATRELHAQVLRGEVG